MTRLLSLVSSLWGNQNRTRKPMLAVYILFFHVVNLHAIRIDPLSRTAMQQQDGRNWGTATAPSSDNNNHDQEHHRRLKSEVNVDIPDSPDGHIVTSLPLWSGNNNEDFPRQWAGHLPASANGDKYFFYWLFAPDAAALSQKSKTEDDVPLIIWLNGGPACSSMDGLFIENGALQLTRDPTTSQYVVTNAPYSWHKAPAYTLYIDQPVGTGLSFTTSEKYPTNDEEINIDFYYFLQQFFKFHSDKFVSSSDSTRCNRDVYFSGESHAGHYIPSMMNYILKQNANVGGSGNIQVPLGGAAIGNGWVEPYYQYAAAEAAYGHGLIGRAQMNAFAEKEKNCQNRLKNGEYSVNVCFSLLDDIVSQSLGGETKFKVSTYDARLSEPKGASRSFPPGHKVIETYLGGWQLKEGGMSSDVYSRVLEAIHATAATDAGQRYKECTDPPYNALSHQDGLGVSKDVVEILDSGEGVRLLFFNGIEDLICNHVGNEKALENLEWSGKDGWIKGKRYAWVSSFEESGKVSGYMQEYENLMYLKLLDSGHMVPLDIPDKALDMIQILINSGSFDTSLQNLPSSVSKAEDCPASECDICPACEECPDIPPGDEASSSETSSGTSNKAVQSTQGTTFAAGMLLMVLLVCVVWGIMCLIGRKKKASHTRVSQYDLELRDRSYMDRPTTNGHAIA